MALDLSELEAMRDTLVRTRARGARVAQINGERVEYQTDAELAAAIADLEARIRRASATPARSVAFHTSKGV